MVSNLKARRVGAGGSTLTQQTAKNLYYRPDRSIRSKLVELVSALRLEAHHDKEAILEFYANQFHVSANGRGLGIAARYFFDKDVEDLTTLVRDRDALGGEATVYVCEGGVCQQPVTDPDTLREQLAAK